MGRKNEKQYIQDTILLCRITFCEQEKVPPEDITEEKQFSNKSDSLEPDLDDEDNT